MYPPAADSNLIRSRANSELEVLLATGHKLWLPPYWMDILGGFFFFLGWSTQAFGQSFPRLVFISVAVVGALSE